MGEVQTDSPALVKVKAATYTSKIPAWPIGDQGSERAQRYLQRGGITK